MRFETPDGPREMDISDAIVAGWTGRDREAVDHHIAELAEIGVSAPTAVPLFYRVSESLLTHAPTIQVLGGTSSGEVEPLLINARGQIWLGLASDHTDRALEVVSVAASKQICAKPVSGALWPLSDVKDHLDQLELRCEIEEGGVFVPYQQGTLSAIRPLQELAADAPLGDGGAILCGTLPAIGGVRPADRYRMALCDPVRDRKLALAYSVTCLPIIE